MEEEILTAAVGEEVPGPGSSPKATSVEGTNEDALQKGSVTENLGLSDAPEQDIGTIITSMTKHTKLAMASRRKEQITRAIKQMNMALAVCDGREAGHPAIAVEAARVRLNLSAMLSRGGRHLEALVAIKEAQRGLSSVVAWASDCGPGDPGVSAIEKEARTLQCAAIVAEAIELEPYAQNDNANSSDPVPSESQLPDSPTAGVGMMHERLYAEANSLAEKCLVPSHPVASLARKLRTESAVCAPPVANNSFKKSVRISPVGSSPLSKSSPHIFGRDANLDEVNQPPTINIDNGQLPDSGNPVDSTPKSDTRSLGASRGKSKGAKSTLGATMGRSLRHGGRRGGEQHDIFTAFLRDAEEEKEARRGAFYDSWQDDARKRLNQVHKRTRLLLQLSEDVELKDKRYTSNGHKVIMENLSKDNRSRSDPALVKEARQNRDTPEVYQVRKLNKKFYVKPPTPPPAVSSKPLMDEELAQMFKRPTPMQSPTNF